MNAAPLDTRPLPRASAQRRTFVATLWMAQSFVALVFIGAGHFKLSAPISVLAATFPWAGEVPEAMVRAIGAIDLAGGLGILLPALTRILPRLTVAAAVGCSVLQVLAISFHAWRGEWSMLGLNAALLTCSLYVSWGRSRVAPIAPRA